MDAISARYEATIASIVEETRELHTARLARRDARIEALQMTAEDRS